MTDRTEKEMMSLFKDPRFARQAWRSIGAAILQNPAVRPIGQYNKEGEPTLAGQIESYSYQKLADDIKALNNTDGRTPTELEMILQCQMLRARFDTNAAVFVRDTLGAKPVDESKLEATVSNPYESLTDEELEMLARMREKNTLPEGGESNAVRKEEDEGHKEGR